MVSTDEINAIGNVEDKDKIVEMIGGIGYSHQEHAIILQK